MTFPEKKKYVLPIPWQEPQACISNQWFLCQNWIALIIKNIMIQLFYNDVKPITVLYSSSQMGCLKTVFYHTIFSYLPFYNTTKTLQIFNFKIYLFFFFPFFLPFFFESSIPFSHISSSRSGPHFLCNLPFHFHVLYLWTPPLFFSS